VDAKVLHVQKPATIVTTIRVTHRMSSLTEKGNRPSWFRFLFPVACQLPRELQVMALQCFGILRALRGNGRVHRVGARLASFRLDATTVILRNHCRS